MSLDDRIAARRAELDQHLTESNAEAERLWRIAQEAQETQQRYVAQASQRAAELRGAIAELEALHAELALAGAGDWPPPPVQTVPCAEGTEVAGMQHFMPPWAYS